MKRREFLAASCAAGLTGLKGASSFAQVGSSGRDFYELRKYTIKKQAQKNGFDAFMAEAGIPALNRIGINPVGVFEPEYADKKILCGITNLNLKPAKYSQI